jgi:2'-5' RNA ligase
MTKHSKTKFIQIFALMFLFTTQALAVTAYQLDAKILDGSSVPFIKHHGKGSMDNYLAMNLGYAPMPLLFQQVQEHDGIKLITRGEAHITVITPVEFSNDLQPYGVSIEQVDEIARSSQIQNSAFQIRCLGRGQATVKGKLETTYFLVIKSPALLEIRRKIQELVKGSPSQFDADKFYSHITVGFTKTDLHEANGVIKDESSCVAELQLAGGSK